MSKVDKVSIHNSQTTGIQNEAERMRSAPLQSQTKLKIQKQKQLGKLKCVSDR